MRPAYEKYKPSGIPWAPEIPAEWKSEPFFAVAKPNKIKNTGIAERNLLSLSYGRVVRKNIDTTFGLLPESFETYQIVDTGHIVFRLTDLQNDKVSLRSALVTEKGIITSAYLAVKFSSLDAKYADYLMRSYDKSAVFYELGGGVRQSAKYDDLKWMPVLTPPMLEQKSIAAFLDEKTAAIDDLIAKKEKLLELLAEKRTALITQAVTKGLDPTAPMKPSGIDWLGDVPKGWDALSLRWCLQTSSGDFIDSQEVEKTPNNKICIPVVGGNGVMAYCSKSNSNPKTLVIGRVGAHCGNVHLIDSCSWVTDNALKVRLTRKEILPKYLFYYLKSLHLNDYANKNAQPLITGEMVKSRLFVLPPFSIQQEIVRFLEFKLVELDALNKKIQAAITKIKEYRTALITNAVTGKIKVA